jgi:hypothetical protein
MSEIWAMELDWPAVCGGVTARGACCADDGISGLNISYYVDADEAKVAQNRRRVLHAMGCEGRPVVRANQVHGTRVVTITGSVLKHLPACPSGVHVREADGLVTQLEGVVLNLAYADCVPVMLYCPAPLTIGVLHAGWRGTAVDIARRGVQRMRRLGCDPSQMRAAIGPAICGGCYEVGPEVVAAMRELPFAGPVVDEPPDDHVDLKELNRLSLLDCGLVAEAVEVSGDCTFCGPASLFSYRRSGGKTGLHGAFAALRSNGS